MLFVVLTWSGFVKEIQMIITLWSNVPQIKYQNWRLTRWERNSWSSVERWTPSRAINLSFHLAEVTLYTLKLSYLYWGPFLGFRKSRNLGENSFGRTRSDDYGFGGGGGGDADDLVMILMVMIFLMMIVMLIMIVLLLMMTTTMMVIAFKHWFKSLRTNFAIILSDLCIQIFVCCRQFFNYFNLLLRCMTRTPNSDPRI